MMRALTFRDRMREEEAEAAAAEAADPWRLTLERVRGKIDFYDRLERISSQTLLDLLEVPQRNRTAGTFRRLSKVMTELGWTALRVRDLTRGGYAGAGLLSRRSQLATKPLISLSCRLHQVLGPPVGRRLCGGGLK
jgi:hypothetical protein